MLPHERIAAELAAERARGIAEHGYGPEHDDALPDDALGRAAATLAFCSTHSPERQRDLVPSNAWGLMIALWPKGWGARFKSEGQRQDLLRAGALLIAAIERLDRAAAADAAASTPES
ncbi:hypothetical protein [Methylobacterium dankookense]|uniref:Uncharacterized protein n=1 Tax=Methylobacterium dankookense TaxID=560405 RepID=A0A564G3J5_9HYPH|nr:hypothetical protein [Methylobacterium dankookense]GJD59811.1 hypothetical protein IFDJLNFL_5742 [Methylobacterium dankookense]VUF15069.1 hypothetical protein MTDSW087_04802 [Methylobacterium dankookense]